MIDKKIFLFFLFGCFLFPLLFADSADPYKVYLKTAEGGICLERVNGGIKSSPCTGVEVSSDDKVSDIISWMRRSGVEVKEGYIEKNISDANRVQNTNVLLEFEGKRGSSGNTLTKCTCVSVYYQQSGPDQSGQDNEPTYVVYNGNNVSECSKSGNRGALYLDNSKNLDAQKHYGNLPLDKSSDSYSGANLNMGQQNNFLGASSYGPNAFNVDVGGVSCGLGTNKLGGSCGHDTLGNFVDLAAATNPYIGAIVSIKSVVSFLYDTVAKKKHKCDTNKSVEKPLLEENPFQQPVEQNYDIPPIYTLLEKEQPSFANYVSLANIAPEDLEKSLHGLKFFEVEELKKSVCDVLNKLGESKKFRNAAVKIKKVGCFTRTTKPKDHFWSMKKHTSALENFASYLNDKADKVLARKRREDREAELSFLKKRDEDIVFLERKYSTCAAADAILRERLQKRVEALRTTINQGHDVTSRKVFSLNDLVRNRIVKKVAGFSRQPKTVTGNPIQLNICEEVFDVLNDTTTYMYIHQNDFNFMNTYKIIYGSANCAFLAKDKFEYKHAYNLVDLSWSLLDFAKSGFTVLTKGIAEGANRFSSCVKAFADCLVYDPIGKSSDMMIRFNQYLRDQENRFNARLRGKFGVDREEDKIPFFDERCMAVDVELRKERLKKDLEWMANALYKFKNNPEGAFTEVVAIVTDTVLSCALWGVVADRCSLMIDPIHNAMRAESADFGSKRVAAALTEAGSGEVVKEKFSLAFKDVETKGVRNPVTTICKEGVQLSSYSKECGVSKELLSDAVDIAGRTTGVVRGEVSLTEATKEVVDIQKGIISKGIAKEEGRVALNEITELAHEIKYNPAIAVDLGEACVAAEYISKNQNQLMQCASNLVKENPRIFEAHKTFHNATKEIYNVQKEIVAEGFFNLENRGLFEKFTQLKHDMKHNAGNFGFSFSGTKEEVDLMGRAWVGKNSRSIFKGEGVILQREFISSGNRYLKQYRPSAVKSYSNGKKVANFELFKLEPGGVTAQGQRIADKWRVIKNGHVLVP